MYGSATFFISRPLNMMKEEKGYNVYREIIGRESKKNIIKYSKSSRETSDGFCLLYFTMFFVFYPILNIPTYRSA